jgi:hypothetical protein
MGHLHPRRLNGAEKAEIWRRWRQGESLQTIGRALGWVTTCMHYVVAGAGGVPPRPRRRSRLALARSFEFRRRHPTKRRFLSLMLMMCMPQQDWVTIRNIVRDVRRRLQNTAMDGTRLTVERGTSAIGAPDTCPCVGSQPLTGHDTQLTATCRAFRTPARRPIGAHRFRRRPRPGRRESSDFSSRHAAAIGLHVATSLSSPRWLVVPHAR